MVLTGVAAVIGACGGGGGSPTSPTPPMVDRSFASFRLEGAGYDDELSFANGPNLVFCRRSGTFADLWIRFAEQPGANGENGPHMDIDVCNPAGGTYQPMDPQSATCAGGRTFDMFWHGDGTVFVNPTLSMSCSLDLVRNGSELSGNFRCRGMGELGGGGTLDVLAGRFRCTEQ
jgi:hypothetical protein